MKGVFPVVFAIVAIAAFAVLLNSGGKLPAFVTYGLDTAVFCNLYEFQSCNYHVDSVASDYVSTGPFYGQHDFICLADRCNILRLQSGGTGTLKLSGNTINSFPYMINANDTLKDDAGFLGSGKIGLDYEVINRRLVWCGSSACDAAVSGVDVAGSSRCTFATDKSIYDSSGKLTRAPSASSISYTVQPTQSVLIYNNQQFICGTKFNQCSVDTDCSAGHTYLYNGLGAEAYAGSLQVYGCVNRGTAPTQDDLNKLPFESVNSTAFNYGARCEVKSTQAVQCIPGTTSCGSNSVCDVKTFTCKASGSVSCTQNADCGAGQVYDPSTKGFYQYGCVNNACQRQLVKTVQCAFNYECPSNWFCDVDNACKEYTLPKQPAPGVCSVGDPRYFDKPPPPGNICCPGGNEFEPTLAQCQNNPNSCSLLNIGACFGNLFGGLALIGQFIIAILVLIAVIFIAKALKK